MFYVLIIITSLTGTTVGVNVTTQEFTSIQKCQEASKIINTDNSKKPFSIRKNVMTFCVEK